MWQAQEAKRQNGKQACPVGTHPSAPRQQGLNSWNLEDVEIRDAAALRRSSVTGSAIVLSLMPYILHVWSSNCCWRVVYRIVHRTKKEGRKEASLPSSKGPKRALRQFKGATPAHDPTVSANYPLHIVLDSEPLTDSRRTSHLCNLFSTPHGDYEIVTSFLLRYYTSTISNHAGCANGAHFCQRQHHSLIATRCTWSDNA